ncbi:MAG: sulfite exporter TauE/SafE family protein [Candidatus Sericytochromatia bacterium]|nr:sulfite exporter TauE/SafE family protein [Candidatus Sericytochromatia bacterium]
MTPLDALYLLLGALTGLLSGLLGVGGGFLLVPALAIGLGWPLVKAVGTSLMYVAAIGLGGAWTHWRAGNLDGRLVAWLAVPAALLAPLGAELAVHLPNAWLALSFSLLLLGVAYSMWRPFRPAEVSDGSEPPRGRAVAWGAVVGVLSGLFGVGGGLLLVPAQNVALRVPLKRAIGNSLAVVLLTGLVGAIAHLRLGTPNTHAALPLIAGGMVGVQAGTWWLARLSVPHLRTGLALFLLSLAVVTGARALAELGIVP